MKKYLPFALFGFLGATLLLAAFDVVDAARFLRILLGVIGVALMLAVVDAVLHPKKPAPPPVDQVALMKAHVLEESAKVLADVKARREAFALPGVPLSMMHAEMERLVAESAKTVAALKADVEKMNGLIGDTVKRANDLFAEIEKDIEKKRAVAAALEEKGGPVQ